MKSQPVGKDPDAGKDWRQKEKAVAEGEMGGWHHRLSGHESEQTPGDGEGQRSLECCRPRAHKLSDTTQQLNNNNAITLLIIISSLVCISNRELF